ncbi:MAG TPA: XRE family transcriptional regulator [Myxococcota bacterium]|nr:XRE family transcriptional regulator [Myxococcota bacterium]
MTQEKLATAFSVEEKLAAATVSSWESLSTPKLPPRHRLLAYARFFATQRSVEAAPPTLLALEELTADEHAVYETLESELLTLRGAAAGDSAEEEIAFSRSWHFADTGRVTFVCAELPSEETGPLTDPTNPNYTELQAFADVDALMELHGHVRAENPKMLVHYKIPAEIDRDDLTGHLILLGGFVWNEITERLSEMARLPIRQFEHPELLTGEIFIADVNGNEKEFWPKWTDRERKVLEEDVGLLARVPNPLNSNRTLTICNGIHSRGVYGAVSSLTDASLRDANERYISTHFGTSESFAILMSVKVINNKAMTPDLGGRGVVLYQWSQRRAA